MAAYFEAETANDAWRQAYHALASEQGALQDSRGGKTTELLHASFNITRPRQRWVLARSPGLNPAFAIVESLWILAGRNDAHMINFWNPAYPRYAGTGETYDGAYGERLRASFGLDQIVRVANVLRNDPDSRQAVLQIWNPANDLPNDKGERASEDIPCNICAMLKVRNGRLEWSQIMRSNDLFLGTPHNFVQFTTLQEVMAGWLGVEMGNYHHISDSLHFYHGVEEQYSCDDELHLPENPDRLGADWSVFETLVPKAIELLDILCSGDLTQTKFRQTLTEGDLPPAYRNMVAVAAADSARRRGWGDEMVWAMAKNDNPLYVMAWERWLAHKPIREFL